VRIGTLSKAIGGLGGFVAGSSVLCDWLWNAARSQFFSTALPPAVCAAARASFEIIQEDNQRRQILADRSVFTRRLLQEHGFQVLFNSTSPETSPIVAVLLGDDDQAVNISARMLDHGFFIPAVRPPTVAAGTARLRMSISCDHSEEQIQAAVYQLRDVMHSVRR
jgi:8-amino-7-oxononanoate synthase